MQVKFLRLRPEAVLPAYQTEWASGFDLHAAEGTVIGPGGTATVDTGWAVQIPAGYELQVRPRSGLAFKHGVTVLNTPGTIDADYRGPVKVILINHGPETFRISPGDRIAQAVLAPVVRGRLVEALTLEDTDRADGGFGSTGI